MGQPEIPEGAHSHGEVAVLRGDIRGLTEHVFSEIESVRREARDMVDALRIELREVEVTDELEAAAAAALAAEAAAEAAAAAAAEPVEVELVEPEGEPVEGELGDQAAADELEPPIVEPKPKPKPEPENRHWSDRYR